VDKRTGLAVALCIVVFVLWFFLVEPVINPRPRTPPRKPAEKPPAAAPAAPAAAPTEVKPAPAAVTAPEARPQDYPDRAPIPFQKGKFKGEFCVQGGGLRSLILRFPDEKGEVPLLQPLEPDRPHFALRLVNGPLALERLPWKVREEKPGEGMIEFVYELPGGLEISKKFEFDPAKHLMKFTVYLRNTNKAAEGQKEVAEQEVQLELLAFNGLVPDDSYRHEQYSTGVAFIEKSLKYVPIADVEKGETKLAEAARLKDEKERQEAAGKAEEYFGFKGPGRQWMGVKNRFFAALLVPAEGKDRLETYLFRSVSRAAQEKGGGLKNLGALVRTQKVRVGSAPIAMEFASYLGPIQAVPLREAPAAGADQLLNYAAGCGCGALSGLFFPIVAVVQLVAPFILSILNFLGRDVFGNYGVGIIVTTIIIRACLFPLSRKSQETAFKMQKLGPQIELLRQRYGDDRQKFGMEQWKLFKEHKVHPASGCLPMVLQLPIFVGMYSVFELSVELRRAPFMLWVRDLSLPDALVRFSGPVNIPLIPVFDSFNVLPLVMTVTWFLQSYYAPRSPDPQMQTQQKMMLFMPVVFGVMCYNLASGLSLYFLVNSLLGMAEQKVIKKFFLKPVEGSSGP
jgi:YidC/Oxa1 family membrane protein insertase